MFRLSYVSSGGVLAPDDPWEATPRSRALHVFSEASALQLLRESRPDLDPEQLRRLAWQAANGLGQLVFTDEYEQADTFAPPFPIDEIDHEPEPLPPPTPSPQKEPTTFVLRVVDELGEPLVGIPIHMLVDGETLALQTDDKGIVRADSTWGASFASARIADIEATGDMLRERWSTPREGEPLAPADDRSFVTVRSDGIPPHVQLTKFIPHTLVFYPDVILVRFIGMYFQTAKSFLLPNPDLPRIRSIYEENPSGDLLVVGHTDSQGSIDYNDALATHRAQAIVAYLRDDVDAWLEHYTSAVPSEQRWGATEDRIMLDAILSRDPNAPQTGRVSYYQATRGLSADGIIGPVTRRSLVTDYMGLDGVTLPASMRVEVHGCGEHFPLDLPEEEQLAEVSDRRVELFFFADGLGALPPPPAPTSDASSPHYPHWRALARRTLEYGLLPQAPHFCFSA